VTTRRERVVLELEDKFTPGAARAAAAAALLKREIDGINGAGSRSSGGGVDKLSKDVDSLSKSAVQGSKEIDKYSGRLRLLADVALVLGPAAVTVGVGLAGMAVSAGVAGLALYGLGDALTALNKYQLDPTEANLKTLNQEMAKAGPAGREFVLFLDGLGPKLTDLQMVARAGFLPGLQQGIESLLTRFPEVRTIVADLAAELGDLAAKGGEWLAGPGFDQFQSFLAYARTQGPAVAEFARALAGALIGIGKAMAPVGAVTLPILTDLIDILAKIANSPIGPALIAAATAFTIVSRSAQLAGFAMGRFGGNAEKAKASLGGFAGKAAGILLVGQALGAVTNALGVGVGINGADLGRDIDKITSGGTTDSLNELAKSLENINEVGGGTVNALLALPSAVTGIKTSFAGSKEVVEQFDQQLAQMVESGNADQAAALFERIRAAARERGGVSDADVVKSFDSYKTALDNAASGAEAYGHAANNATEDTQTWVQQIAAASKAMKDNRSAALGAFDAITQYGDALAAAKAAADKGKRGIDANTKAGRENRQAISQLAAAWNNQSDAVRNNSDKFRKARSDFITTATAMGVPEAAARRLARRLLEIPDSKVVKVSAETAQARSALASIMSQINDVPRTVRTDYIVNQITRISKINAGSAGTQTGNHGTGADGTTVPKTGLPYADRHLYLLADGEEVISNRNGQADRNRLLLKDINAGRLADGGTSGAVSLAASFGVDIDRGDGIKKRLRLLGVALERATDRLRDETSARDSLIGTIKGNLTGDLFGGSGNASVFSRQYAPGSIGDVNSRLRSQINDANQQTALETRLHARGLGGPALQALIEQGGIEGLRSFTAASSSDLRTYQALYGQRGTAVDTAARTGASVTGLTAAQDRTTGQVAVLNATVQSLQKQLDRMHADSKRDRAANADRTGHAVAAAHDRAAKNARRR
jgi:hypothetical protein